MELPFTAAFHRTFEAVGQNALGQSVVASGYPVAVMTGGGKKSPPKSRSSKKSKAPSKAIAKKAPAKSKKSKAPARAKKSKAPARAKKSKAPARAKVPGRKRRAMEKKGVFPALSSAEARGRNLSKVEAMNLINEALDLPREDVAQHWGTGSPDPAPLSPGDHPALTPDEVRAMLRDIDRSSGGQPSLELPLNRSSQSTDLERYLLSILESPLGRRGGKRKISRRRKSRKKVTKRRNFKK